MRPVDGTRVKEYLTCARIPYLSFHRPKEVELPPTPRMEVLFRTGRRVEARILEDIAPVDVEFERGDFQTGFEATCALMDEGASAIANGVLITPERLGRPDLLLRNSDGVYEVADVKSSQKVHASARLQVAFYSRMLGELGAAPRRGYVIVRDGTRIPFELGELDATLDHLLARIDDSRRGEDPGPHRTEACLDCRYRDLCAADLEVEDDVAGLPGLTRAQAGALRAAGVSSIGALADLERPGPTARASGLPSDLVRRVSRRARAARDGAPLRVVAPRDEVAAAQIALVALINERLDPAEIAVAGLVLDDREKFLVRFLRRPEAIDPLAEFRAFVVNLDRSRGPILTFGPALSRVLERIVDRLPWLGSAVERVRRRAIDLRAELRRSVALPGFDRTLALAARAAGIAPVEADPSDVDALRYLEGEPGADIESVHRRLRHELDTIARLRDELCRGEAGAR